MFVYILFKRKHCPFFKKRKRIKHHLSYTVIQQNAKITLKTIVCFQLPWQHFVGFWLGLCSSSYVSQGPDTTQTRKFENIYLRSALLDSRHPPTSHAIIANMTNLGYIRALRRYDNTSNMTVLFVFLRFVIVLPLLVSTSYSWWVTCAARR